MDRGWGIFVLTFRKGNAERNIFGRITTMSNMIQSGLRYLLIISLFSSCLSPGNKTVDFRNQYYTNNEDQFTFIILDKAECDSFIEKYQPLNNPALIKTIQ